MTEVPDRPVPGGGADDVPVADLLPEGWAELLARVKSDVLSTRLRAMWSANTELIALPVDRTNWRIGRLILERQRTQSRGSVCTRVDTRLHRRHGEPRSPAASSRATRDSLGRALTSTVRSVRQRMRGCVTPR